MAIPPNTTIFSDEPDPRDLQPWKILASRSLEVGESIATFDLVLGAEAVAAGLVIRNDGARAPELVDEARAIKIWMSIQDDMRLDPMFSGAGVLLPIEVTIRTNSIPYREFQKTAGVRVSQQ